jgi:rhodanese-related sulfurtransferase
MRRFATSISVALVIGLTFVARVSATDIGKLLENKEGPDQFEVIHVADLAKLMADPASHVQVFDANHPSTRAQFGVIQGAHLLSSYDNYDVAKELPADKNTKIVFYCADSH